ncbi:Hypothetical predicted protein [Cloeon dipterum]|uniref:Uncharacterized protein n=2 Tax=Cloeon dipterum TaxID=197152 RepID=A0A8S1CNY9_9INSE|nr:Hypothetical predicted protein [Cloeon dipterum]
MQFAVATTLCVISCLHLSYGQRVYLWQPRNTHNWDASPPSKWPPFIWHHGHPSSRSFAPHPPGSSKMHPAKSASRKELSPRHAEWDPPAVFVAIPIPVPVSVPAAAAAPTPAEPGRRPARGGALGLTAAAAGLQMQTTSTSSSGGAARGPISATVTLTGAGGLPVGATTTSTSTASGLFPALAAFQTQGVANTPAAQAAAQVVAAAQAAYNAQAAFQAQAAEATRAATQAAYAQQAAELARNAANTVTTGIGAQLPALQPFGL